MMIELQPLTPSPGAHAVPPWVERPKRRPNVELHGRMPDTAFAEERWLICVNGQYHEVTPLLYHVLAAADGKTPAAIIAAQVSQQCGRSLSADDIRWLVTNRLIPAGLLAIPVPASAASGSTHGETRGNPTSAAPRTREQALGLRARVPLISYETIAPITGILQHLYWPPLIVLTVLLAIGVHIWLYRSPALLVGAQTLLRDPALVLVLFGMEIGSSFFHELGHAAAMRRGGCRHGPIGVAIYLIWPAFYTDVTDVYRLNRLQRLRVDLGGMYFQLFLILGYAMLYQLTGWPFWLLGIVSIDLHYMRQFTPFLRFDGYYAIADLLGVPDPLALVGPFLRDIWPWPRGRKKQLPRMRPLPRLLFMAYLVLVAYFLIYPFFLGTFYGKEVVTTLWWEGRALLRAWLTAWRTDPVLLAAVSLQLLFWFIMVLGLGLFVRTVARMALALSIAMVRLGRHLVSRLRAQPSLRQARHPLVVAVFLAIVVLVGAGGMFLPVADRFGSQAASEPATTITSSSQVVQALPPDQLQHAITALTATWARFDQPVQQGMVQRSWIWGPAPRTALLLEPYTDAPGGQRLVLYFDKARMEVTHPGEQTAADAWYVTTGLLAKELITGQLQTGDTTFEPRAPAQIAVAGDLDDPNAPTYASLAGLLQAPPAPVGTVLTSVLHRDGSVTNDPALARYHVTAAYLAPETGHSIASVFWDMLQAQGIVADPDGLHTAPLFSPPFYVTGLPITEAYWTQVLVAGHPHDVLLQCFERRCLTYTPDNPAGWQVEMGNIGQHYYLWRYSGTPSPQPLTTPPVLQQGEGTPSAPPATTAPSPRVTVVATVVVTSSGEGTSTATCQQAHSVQSNDGAVSATSSQQVNAVQQGGKDTATTAKQSVTCSQRVTISGP